MRDTIDMAREAGMESNEYMLYDSLAHTAWVCSLADLKAFEALVRADERSVEQEPVAWMCSDERLSGKGYERFSRTKDGPCNIPVYTTTPAAPVQEPVAKLQVTLQDRPIDIELAQYKRMFESACSALGAIGDALGCDPEEGGAEPILAAIAELKATPPAAQRQWVGLTDDEKLHLIKHNPYKSAMDLLNAHEAKLREKNT